MILLVMLYSLILGGIFCLAGRILERVLAQSARQTRLVWVGIILLITLFTGLPFFEHTHFLDSGAGLPFAQAIGQTAVQVFTPVHWWLYWLDPWFAVGWGILSAVAAGALVSVVVWGVRSLPKWTRREVDGQEVHLSEDTGPAVVGFLFQRIVLPRWAVDASESTRSVMIAHEAEHLRTRDSLLLVLAAFALVIAPWNPFLWWSAGRLRLAIEVDCDRRVLASGTFTIRTYVGALLETAGSAQIPPMPVPAFARTYAMLEGRLSALTSPARSRPLAVAALMLLLAGTAVLAGALEVPRPDAIICGLRGQAAPTLVPIGTIFYPIRHPQ